MVSIRYVNNDDKQFWMAVDRHVSDEGFDRKVRDRSGYVLFDDGIPAGVMHYTLLWDRLPCVYFVCGLVPCR